MWAKAHCSTLLRARVRLSRQTIRFARSTPTWASFKCRMLALEPLREISKTNKVIPAAIEFVDIAGLVAGASKGEGLGNKFLANIREVDAIVHVVRCFDDDDIIHTLSGHRPAA